MDELNILNPLDNNDYLNLEDFLMSEKTLFDLDTLNDIFAQLDKVSTKRVLVIEDDSTFEPIWEHIINNLIEKTEFYWASSAEQAIDLIYKSREENRPFDLIISDIFLSGSVTGIDLWKQFDNDENFLLISRIDNKKLVEEAKKLDKVPPPYLKKPLDVVQCSKMVTLLLNLEA